jgi:ATP-dependent protease ClpP protease subunit
MQRDAAHIYFLDSIGLGDWFYGTTLNDVRYCVEGWAAMDGGSAADNELPKTVYLHFPACKGGDVLEGYGIYNYLRGLAARGVKVVAQVEGLCASIATLIALAADTVEMAEAALWMVHKPASSGGGTADDLRAEADILDKIQAQLVSRYVARCGGKLDAITANELINKTSWLTADECAAYGFITGKLHEAPLVAPVGTEAVLNYFPTTKQPAPTMAITPAEKKSIVDDVIDGVKGFLTSFKNEAPAPEAAPAIVNATTVEITGGEPMYTADAELAIGSAVFSDEALTIAYPDAEYDLTDGRTATVLAGLIDELDVAATDEATAAATAAAELAATNTALLAEIATLQASNATLALNVTGLTNRLKLVPGTKGNPTPAGTQTITNKAGAPAAAAAPFTIRKV